MEKIFWIRSHEKRIGQKDNDGLEEINRYLEEGWKVKHLSACSAGDSVFIGQAYVVLEKEI